jgi:hypothetical protein
MATTSHRHPKIIEMAFDVARSTSGRTVVRPYIAPGLIICAGRRYAVVAAGDYVRAKTPLRSVLRSHPSPLLTPLSRRLQRRRQPPSQSSVVPNFFVSTNQLNLPYVLGKT